ncbi:MAG: hypothetical protein ACRC3Z_13315 [Phocaeicola sp.]
MNCLIRESGMDFLIQREDFCIETSVVYQQVNNRGGMKVCEFICLRENSILFIEAKCSFSKPQKAEDFTKNLADIKEKFMGSFLLFHAMIMGRFAKHTLPSAYQQLKWAEVDYRFYLVIHGFEEEWMIPIMNELKSELRLLYKNWNIPDYAVKVINDKRALELGFIQG